MPDQNEVNCFARSQVDNNQLIGLFPKDRRYHFYIIGKTGMGKSTLLERMIVSDITAGRGVGLIDPHGDLSAGVLSHIPKHRIKHTIYFNPADSAWPLGFNILHGNIDQRHLLASQVVSIFYKLWQDSWGPRLEHLLRNTLLALLETQSPTLLGAQKILVDERYRKAVIKTIQDPMVKSYWIDEFEKYPDRFQREVISPLQNKLGAILTNEHLRNIVGQKKSSFDIKEVINSENILIANLSKGIIGEDSSRLLGAMLVTQIQLASMAQAKKSEHERKDFYLYVDEFQNYATSSFIDILSEARKYKLNLTLAHQYLDQLDQSLKSAVLGNVGTIAVFRIGADDAMTFENEFAPQCNWQTLSNLFPYEMYVKLMINGIICPPLPAESLPPIGSGNPLREKKIIEYMRRRYGHPKEKIEQIISRWLANPTI
jgi:hypothetical protein